MPNGRAHWALTSAAAAHSREGARAALTICGLTLASGRRSSVCQRAWAALGSHLLHCQHWVAIVLSAGGRVTVWCGHQLAGHRLVGSRALAGRVVHARTRKPQPASSDFNALLDRYAWLVCRLAVRSACCTKADLASCRLGSTSYCIDTCCLPRRILQRTEPPNRS